MRALKVGLAAAVALIVVSVARRSWASEDFQPFLEGTTTGTPAGALPPPGVYLTNQFVLSNSGVVRGPGSSITRFYTLQAAYAPTLLWATGRKFLGAQYAVMLTQPFAWRNESHAPGIAGTSATGAAFFNTIITPIALSWDLGHGWFLGSGVTVYLPDGTRSYIHGQPGPHNYANDFWTLEPNFALSYLKGGWDVTVNNVFDFNTSNPRTHYRSGDGYYADITVAKSVGRWTVGLAGNYSRQLTDDTHLGAEVGPSGHRFEHVLAGPLVAYQLGPYQLMVRALLNLRTQSDVNFNMYYVSVSFKL